MPRDAGSARGQGLVQSRFRRAELGRAQGLGGAQVHLGQDLQPLVAPDLADPLGELQVRIAFTRPPHVVGLAGLAEVTSLWGPSADADERREIAEGISLMHLRGSSVHVCDTY